MPGTWSSWLIVTGIVLIVLGLLVKLGVLSWIGQLPGDMHIKREGFQFYFPLTTMILISIVLSGILAFIRKFF